MEYRYQTARQAMDHYFEIFWPRKVAAFLNVDDAHIYRARRGDYTPTLVKRLRERGVIPPPEPRVRWSPGCTPDLRDAIRAECDRLELTGAEMLVEMWAMWTVATAVRD